MSIKTFLPLRNRKGTQTEAAGFDRSFLYILNDLKHQVLKIRFRISFGVLIFLFRLYVVVTLIFFRRKQNICKRRKTDYIIIKATFKVILRPLYDGTLVNSRTTAPQATFGRSYQAQLVPLWSLIVLTTLTRCFADSNIHVDSSSPHINSKITSSILVSKLYSPTHTLQSFSRTADRERTKRELSKTLLNQILEPFRTSKVSKRPVFNNRKYTKESLSIVRNGVSEGVSVKNSSDNFSEENELVVGKLNGKVFVNKKSVRPMPPVYNNANHSSIRRNWILIAASCSVLFTVIALFGIVTCIVSNNRSSGASGDRGTASDPHNAAPTPTQAPMLSVVSAGATAGVGGMDHHRLRGGRMGRELAAARDRQVRLAALTTDLQINLPPSIQMPDGEDHPYNSRLMQIRDAEQEAEIYQKCIRPPPNRTVLESESPPPYRSSSAGYLGSSSTSSSSSSCSDWSSSTGTGGQPLVVRCHSMSSSSTKRPQLEAASSSAQKTDFLQRTVKIFTGKKTQTPPPPAPTLPAVTVPNRHRRTTEKTPRPGV